jgi:16S rRNA (adenine1518-N6/adenine1519-N6)-dimethyltransferase
LDEAAVDPAPSPSRGPRRTLTPSSLRSLAERHAIRPRKSLGQHFLIEPNLARRIAELAGPGPGDRVVEVGPGLGSLTVALALTGADVVAVEVDPRLAPALEEALAGFDRVRVVVDDAVRADWRALLPGEPWVMVANLPYNVAVPVVMRVLDEEPRVRRLLVMVQREVGERLAAGPGDAQYGAVSVRVAYRASARVVRPVARSVFWPRPNVDSVLVLLERRPPPVRVDEAALWSVIREAFAQRRKTIRSALVRMGLSRERADEVLAGCGIAPQARPEELGLEAFACLAGAVSKDVP